MALDGMVEPEVSRERDDDDRPGRAAEALKAAMPGCGVAADNDDGVPRDRSECREYGFRDAEEVKLDDGGTRR